MPSTMGVFSTAVVLFSAITIARPHIVPRIVSADGVLASYDYVIIGGGTGGMAVAGRLSEDSSKTVLVIESGPLDDGSEMFTVPFLGAGYLVAGTKYDWNITSAPAGSLGNRSLVIPHGRVLGGTSAFNGMQLLRGAAGDYDAWAELGNDGWDFKSLYKFFKKSETFTAVSKEKAAEYGITQDDSAHGFNGYIHSSIPKFLWPQQKNWFRAMNGLGHPTAQDPANGNALQAFWTQNSLDPTTQTRSFSREYYDGAVDRPNFHALLDNSVTKLVTSRSKKGVRVDAVEFSESAGSPRRTIKVTREAVLAAGAVFSPQLLQVSGIGPAELLRSLGIEVVIDLPGVGSNFQGHVYIPTVFPMSNVPLTPFNLTTNTTYFNEMHDLYVNKREGPLTVPGTNAVAMLPLADFSSRVSEILADLGSNVTPITDSTVAKGYAVQLKILRRRLRTTTMAATELMWFNEGAVVASVMHPLSRGTVTTKSADMFTLPIVTTGYLDNPADAKILIDSVKYIRKIMQTSEMQELGPIEAFPGPDVITDEQIEQATKGALANIFHITGTCAMMSKDLGGVVGPDLKVYGTTNLRVADASMQPLVPASHTQGTVYAVAEKASPKGGPLPWFTRIIH